MSKFKATKWLEMADRPRCHIEGCNRPRQYLGSATKDGSMQFRKSCESHHINAIAEKHGFESTTQYTNSKHPYLRYRKSYCENIDSRFGFKCTTTIMIAAMLQVDHIDGNPSNNDITNLQTLCACCHVYKTLINRDYLSPGRKALKEKRVFECFA